MSKIRRLLLSALIASLMLALSVIPAAADTTAETQSELHYDVFMQLDGIEGESTVEHYENWIVLSGVRFEVTNTSSNSSGSGGGSGKAAVKKFVVTKMFDSSSISLFQNALNGKHMRNGKIVFVSRGESATPLLTIELNDVNVSSYDFNNANEAISLEFGKIQLSYSATDAKGNKLPPLNGGFDLKLFKIQ